MKNDLIKISFITLGGPGVGKSSISQRFCNNYFNQNPNQTIGIDYFQKTIEINSKMVSITVWDTAGQERFLTLTSQYFRKAEGILLIFDLTDKSSFNRIKELNERFFLENFNSNKNIPSVLIGNKADEIEKREVSSKEANAYAEMQEIKYFETSAKTGTNVKECFESIILLSIQSKEKAKLYEIRENLIDNKKKKKRRNHVAC